MAELRNNLQNSYTDVQTAGKALEDARKSYDEASEKLKKATEERDQYSKLTGWAKFLAELQDGKFS